ncbi:MAG: DNA mismatch repair protein MutS, partial [Clostridia bacterium]|nr:DNA mismatch repair protein MutS [Clostridia bacterium]
IAAKKKDDDIVFLRKIVRGGTDDSYGIEVAKLAGVPDNVIKRAKTILKTLEDNDLMKPKMDKVIPEEKEEPQFQMSFESNSREYIMDRLRTVDINTLTPIEAMGLLYELIDKAKN